MFTHNFAFFFCFQKSVFEKFEKTEQNVTLKKCELQKIELVVVSCTQICGSWRYFLTIYFLYFDEYSSTCMHFTERI